MAQSAARLRERVARTERFLARQQRVIDRAEANLAALKMSLGDYS